MNLLLISVKSELALGGIAVWTERFLAGAKQQNIHCTLVNTEPIGSRVKTGKRKLRDELVRTRRIFRDLKRQLRTGQFDAAYLNTSCGTFGLFRDAKIARLIRKYNIPLITQYHCEIPWWVKRRSAVRCLGQLAAMSTHNLVLCQNSKEFLQEKYGIPSHKIPNFVESAMVRNTDKEIRPTIERICFVGVVSRGKGAEELLAVAKAMPDIAFELIGDVSPDITERTLPDNVTLVGGITNEQVITRLDAADVFLFPSHTEGCSMALMEAMARGLPCIATDVGANADMLGGNCGIVVKPLDVDAMTDAIKQLRNVALRQALSRNAVNKVRAQYTEENVRKILTIVETMK